MTYDLLADDIIVMYVTERQSVMSIRTKLHERGHGFVSRIGLTKWLRARDLLRKKGAQRGKPAPRHYPDLLERVCVICQQQYKSTVPAQKCCTSCSGGAYGRHWRYNITPHQFEQMLERQQRKCVGCECEFGPTKKIKIDHDHVTNRVRGLLCNTCNVCVGMAKDDPQTLRNLASYLENV